MILGGGYASRGDLLLLPKNGPLPRRSYLHMDLLHNWKTCTAHHKPTNKDDGVGGGLIEWR